MKARNNLSIATSLALDTRAWANHKNHNYNQNQKKLLHFLFLLFSWRELVAESTRNQSISNLLPAFKMQEQTDRKRSEIKVSLLFKRDQTFFCQTCLIGNWGQDLPRESWVGRYYALWVSTTLSPTQAWGPSTTIGIRHHFGTGVTKTRHQGVKEGISGIVGIGDQGAIRDDKRFEGCRWQDISIQTLEIFSSAKLPWIQQINTSIQRTTKVCFVETR